MRSGQENEPTLPERWAIYAGKGKDGELILRFPPSTTILDEPIEIQVIGGDHDGGYTVREQRKGDRRKGDTSERKESWRKYKRSLKLEIDAEGRICSADRTRTLEEQVARVLQGIIERRAFKPPRAPEKGRQWLQGSLVTALGRRAVKPPIAVTVIEWKHGYGQRERTRAWHRWEDTVRKAMPRAKKPQESKPIWTELIDDLTKNLPKPYSETAEKRARASVALTEQIWDKGRIDLEDRRYIAIDPPDARDRDDAVWCEETEDGWRLGVAIADVAAYVARGSELDRSAKTRGTSVYLPDRVLPMLPEALSNDACSLQAGKPRRVLVTRMEIDREGQIHTVQGWCMRPATARVHETLSYEEAWKRKDEPALKALRECADALRAKRAQDGALIIEEGAEIGFTGEKKPEGFRIKTNSRAGEWIEEAMIAANRTNAEWLAGTGQPEAVFRTHEAPSQGDLEYIRKRLAGRGDQRVIRQEVLELVERAEYRREARPHFGVGAAIYAHTTSPIRRYADLLCQRAAHDAHQNRITHRNETAQNIGAHLEEREWAAKYAEREAVKRWCALVLLGPLRKDEPGVIVSVREFGVFVEMDSLPGVQGMTHVSELGEGWVEYWGDELHCEESGESWRAGQGVMGYLIADGVRQGRIGAVVQKKQRRRQRNRRRRKDGGTGS